MICWKCNRSRCCCQSQGWKDSTEHSIMINDRLAAVVVTSGAGTIEKAIADDQAKLNQTPS